MCVYTQLPSGTRGPVASLRLHLNPFFKYLSRKTLGRLHSLANAFTTPLYGPRREKTCLREFANNKEADQPAPIFTQSDQHLEYSLIGKYHI